MSVEHHKFCDCSRFVRNVVTVSGLDHTSCQDGVVLLPHLPTPVTGWKKWFVHSQCVHNVLSALSGRVFRCVPSPQRSRVESGRRIARLLGTLIGSVRPISYEQVVRSFVGVRRQRYQRAHDWVRKHGVYYSSNVKMFVKVEKIQFNPDKVNPDCRPIQFRDPRYLLTLARYIKPFEHSFYSIKDVFGCRGQIITKGMTPQAKADLLHQKASHFAAPYFMELDAARFDAHVDKELLKLEHAVYNRCFNDPVLRKLLTKQLINRGSCSDRDSTWRVNYTVEGRRMSGDMNTGCGNNVDMLVMLVDLGLEMVAQGTIRSFDIMLDGDDSVFIVDRVPSEEFVKDFFLGYGMSIKVDNITNVIEEVTFCQARVVTTAEGRKFVRDPSKVITATLVNPKFRDVNSLPRLLKTIAQGELSLCYGVPVLDPFFRSLLRCAEGIMSKRGRGDGGLLKHTSHLSYRLADCLPSDWKRMRHVNISQEARDSFARAWGISITEQRRLEDAFSQHTLSLDCWTHGDGVDVSRWLFDAFAREFRGGIDYSL